MATAKMKLKVRELPLNGFYFSFLIKCWYNRRKKIENAIEQQVETIPQSSVRPATVSSDIFL